MSGVYARLFHHQERARKHGDMSKLYMSEYLDHGDVRDLQLAVVEAREAAHYGALYLTSVAPILTCTQNRIEELVFAAGEGMRPISSYATATEVYLSAMTLALRVLQSNRKLLTMELVRSTAYRLILEVEPAGERVM